MEFVLLAVHSFQWGGWRSGDQDLRIGAHKPGMQIVRCMNRMIYIGCMQRYGDGFFIPMLSQGDHANQEYTQIPVRIACTTNLHSKNE